MRYRPSKMRDMVITSDPKYGESGKTKTCAFMRQLRFHQFCWIYSARLAKPVSNHVQASWYAVTPPANECPPPGIHGRHWHPWPHSVASVALVGRGDARDWPTNQWAHWGSDSSVPSHPEGQEGDLIGAVRWERYTCLTHAHRLRGEPGTGDGAPCPAGGRPRRNGAPTEFVLLRLGRPVFYGSEVDRFCWGVSLGGPLPGERYPGKWLCGAVICPCHNMGGPSSTCGGTPPNPIAVNEIREGGEAPGERRWPELTEADLIYPWRRIVPPMPYLRKTWLQSTIESVPENIYIRLKW